MAKVNCLQIHYLYQENLKKTSQGNRFEQDCARLNSILYRVIVPGLNGPKPKSGRMTLQEVETAKAFLATQPARKIRLFPEALEAGYMLMATPSSTQKQYGPIAHAFIRWAIDVYSTEIYQLNEQPHCPKMWRGHGSHSQPHVTARRGRFKRLAVKLEDLPENCQEVVSELLRYSLDSHYPGRVIKQLAQSTTERYLRMLLTMFGIRMRLADLGPVALHELTMQHLCPHIADAERQLLSKEEQRAKEKEHTEQVEQFICSLFAFIKENNGTYSPGTRAEYITVMIWLFRFLHRSQVRCKAGYQVFETEQMLKHRLSVELQTKQEWKRRNRQVVDIELKYPDFEEDRTQLEIVQQEIIEPLRLETFVRNRWKTFRQPRGIAISLQRFIVWYLLGRMPARRQQDLRSLKIANSCQLQDKPEELPEGGFVFPLPPSKQRQQDKAGFPCDNFLIFVYEFNGKQYEHGAFLWLLDAYKTAEHYGSVVFEIPNYKFEDDSCFYSYLQQFLFGIWTARVVPHAYFYQGLDETLKGTKGVWATLGRNEFSPCGLNEAEHGAGAQTAWHYLFIQPRAGIPYNAVSFGKFFQRPAYRLIQKLITPHLMRRLWASWGFQKGLTEEEIEALAFAMGHSAQTLKNIYQHLSHAERLQPLQEVLRRFYEADLYMEDDDESLSRLKSVLSELSPQQQQSIKQFLDDMGAA